MLSKEGWIQTWFIDLEHRFQDYLDQYKDIIKNNKATWRKAQLERLHISIKGARELFLLNALGKRDYRTYKEDKMVVLLKNIEGSRKENHDSLHNEWRVQFIHMDEYKREKLHSISDIYRLCDKISDTFGFVRNLHWNMRWGCLVD